MSRLDEEMIENLFGVTARAASENDGVKRSPFTPIAEKNEILDPRKAHNIAIQLRARGLSRVEVCDALLDGKLVSCSVNADDILFEKFGHDSNFCSGGSGDPPACEPASYYLNGPGADLQVFTCCR